LTKEWLRFLFSRRLWRNALSVYLRAFGGYVGFTPFVATSARRVYVTSDERNFQQLYSAQCQ
jgi:hypothetical protein